LGVNSEDEGSEAEKGEELHSEDLDIIGVGLLVLIDFIDLNLMMKMKVIVMMERRVVIVSLLIVFLLAPPPPFMSSRPTLKDRYSSLLV
jgi:hypothetical protein